MTSCAHLLLVYSDPVNGPEPFVVLNVVDTVFQISKPLRNVELEQIAQQVFDVCAEMWRESNLQSHGKFQVENPAQHNMLFILNFIF